MRYLMIRLTLAAIVISAIAWRYRSVMDIGTLRDGALLGIFLFLSYLFQMWGIRFTSASNAGFITGLNVVFVPVFSVLFFRDRPRVASLAGVLLATYGLFLLSGGDFARLNKGDWLVFICAIAVTFHVILTGKFAVRRNIYLLTAVQLCVTAFLSLILNLFESGPLVPVMTFSVVAIFLYLALFGTVYTFLMQTAMQRFTTATRTALVFAMEPVFAALFAFLIASEMLTITAWIGGLFIICGMMVAEIDWKSVLPGKGT